jgi:hypothetical protein
MQAQGRREATVKQQYHIRMCSKPKPKKGSRTLCTGNHSQILSTDAMAGLATIQAQQRIAN